MKLRVTVSQVVGALSLAESGDRQALCGWSRRRGRDGGGVALECIALILQLMPPVSQ
jgi:hypothetical protein